MEKKIRRNLLRDFLVYGVSSLKIFGKGGGILSVFKDWSYFSTWWKFRNTEFGTVHYEIPWLVFGAIDYLRENINSDMNVFEYGSGGSTIFFSNRVKHIHSVEHDTKWFNIASQSLSGGGRTNIRYQLVTPHEDPEFSVKKISNPLDYISSRSEYAGLSFEQYVRIVDEYPDASIDLLVVDGRVRTACIQHGMKKIKIGGALLLDNAERKEYLAPFPELMDRKKWKLLKFIGHFPYAPASVINETYLFIRQQ